MQTKKNGANSQKRTGGAARSGRNSNSSRPKMGYAPVAMSRAVGSGRTPRITSTGGVTHIDHTEYFYSMWSAGTAYAVSSYPLNPGVASIFPWLSSIAQRYEKYRFRSLSFDYHTRAATSQVGTVGMVFDFDAQDAAPLSQMEALTYHDKVADSPWKDSCLRVDLAQGDRFPVRYTRAGLPSGTYDIKTYDLGNLHVFVDGVAASTNLGLLEVNYSIDLFTPQVQPSVGGTLLQTTGGMDRTHLFGTVATSASDPQSVLPGKLTSTSVFTFDQTYEGLVCFSFVGTDLSGFSPVASGGGIASLLWEQFKGDATAGAGWFRVSATPGTTITPVLATGTTVTASNFVFARLGYYQA